VAFSSRSGDALLAQVLSPPHNYAPEETSTNDESLAKYASHLLYCHFAREKVTAGKKGACSMKDAGPLRYSGSLRGVDMLVAEAARIDSSYS